MLESLKALFPTLGGICPSNLTYLAFLNAFSPILVTVDGIDKNVKFLPLLTRPKLTLRNALLPIVESVLESINVFKEVLSFNVSLAILLIVVPSLIVAFARPKYYIECISSLAI